jgi:hypothetical protein
MSRQRAGSIAVVVGGLVFLVAQTFLDYVEIGPYSYTVWHLNTRVPIILTVVAVVAVALAVASLITDAVLFPILALACSFFLLGRDLPIQYRHYSGLGVGLWLATAAVIAMSVGGALALTGRASFAKLS